MKINQVQKRTAIVLVVALLFIIISLPIIGTWYGYADKDDKRYIHLNSLLTPPLVFKGILNIQNVLLDTHPPTEIVGGQPTQFKWQQAGGAGSPHLKIEYYVNRADNLDPTDTVIFGFKGETWFDLECFAETPDDIKVSHEGCNKVDTKFTFDSK